MRVAFQGELGAYSDLAVRRYWGRAELEQMPVPTLGDVFDRVIASEAEYGVVPLENSLTGSLHINLDRLLVSDLSIVGEIIVRIAPHLLALPGSTLAGLQEVWAHPQDLEQCAAFLGQHGRLRRVACYDSAGAARQLRDEGRRQAAVIAGGLAAQLYGLEPLATEIADHSQNYTRYWILGRAAEAYGGPDAKTSLVFGFRDAPGALFKCLSIFALRNINLLKLESRPIQGRPWQYLFYTDLAGSLAEENLARACATLQEVTTYYRALGSYRLGPVVE